MTEISMVDSAQRRRATAYAQETDVSRRQERVRVYGVVTTGSGGAAALKTLPS